MSQLTKSKIEWVLNADSSPGYGANWIVGCTHGCTVETVGFDCYGEKKTIKRVSFIYASQEINYLRSIRHPNVEEKTKGLWRKIDDYIPTFLEHRFAKELPRKPSTIFVNPLSDPACWEPLWHNRIAERVSINKQHRFILLTKDPNTYLGTNIVSRESNAHVVLGVTALSGAQIRSAQNVLKEFPNHTTFLSIEPLQTEINPAIIDRDIIDLVIVGGLSGAGVKPKRQWVNQFGWYHRNSKLWGHGKKRIRYFEKNNLQGIVNRELIQELPWLEAK